MDNLDVTGDVLLEATLTADLSRSRFVDLLNSENDKRCSNHRQKRLRIKIKHDLSSLSSTVASRSLFELAVA
jgi:hypothetical protein